MSKVQSAHSFLSLSPLETWINGQLSLHICLNHSHIFTNLKTRPLFSWSSSFPHYVVIHDLSPGIAFGHPYFLFYPCNSSCPFLHPTSRWLLFQITFLGCPDLGYFLLLLELSVPSGELLAGQHVHLVSSWCALHIFLTFVCSCFQVIIKVVK